MTVRQFHAYTHSRRTSVRTRRNANRSNELQCFHHHTASPASTPTSSEQNHQAPSPE